MHQPIPLPCDLPDFADDAHAPPAIPAWLRRSFWIAVGVCVGRMVR